MSSSKDVFFDEPLTPGMFRRIRARSILYSANSPYQQIDVVETEEYGRVLYLDRRFQTSEAEEYFYHESLVHPAMVIHSVPRKVLLIGGGDGGALEEILKYRTVERVDMVELDGKVIEVARRFLNRICANAFEDPRLNLVVGDGRAFIEKSSDSYDVIILDLTDPMGPSKYVYTKEFYDLCRDHLNPGGLLSLHNDSPFFYPEAFAVIVNTLKAVFPHMVQFVTFIPGYLLDFAFSVCSSSPIPERSGEEAEAILRRQGLDASSLKWYEPERHGELLKLPAYARVLLKQEVRISTDDDPYSIPEM
ncbi:polyamine aminopropyltransferase [Thermodesulforhabdus norvegica]|uniref:Polyamine aminopropyltransferase n=1 Tax=Thermodesulforhabdus norvegica TaxID=39841 RepID=A0A1I4W641_9BACT|nr:polyamine aminopropyltransferase [Thermodesulforhabdus norvegica]SFN08847.1 spermidine synthase [Thermodesulforhabdus norvegica]